MIARIDNKLAPAHDYIQYPILLIVPEDEKKDLVVLFINETEGYRICNGKMSAELESWIPATDKYWRRFNGTITLSN